MDQNIKWRTSNNNNKKPEQEKENQKEKEKERDIVKIIIKANVNY